MGLWANDLASAARFYAVPATTSTRLPVLDFLQLYNNASGLSFAGVGDQLTGMNLARANLSLCDLTGVTSLSGCNLSAANLQQAKLNEPNLAGACLSAADFTDAHLANCVFANLGPATSTTVVQPPINFYFQSDGIADCSFMDPGTLGFTFDFDSSGKRDHLVFYHPKRIVRTKKPSTSSRVMVMEPLPIARVATASGNLTLRLIQALEGFPSTSTAMANAITSSSTALENKSFISLRVMQMEPLLSAIQLKRIR
jgi:hypothetical protein